MDRVHTIRITVPFHRDLFSFFERLHLITQSDTALSNSANIHLPRTVIQHAKIPAPIVSFDTNLASHTQTLRQKNLQFGFNIDSSKTIGSIFEYLNSDTLLLGSETVQLIEISTVQKALEQSTLSVNHTGINISPNSIKQTVYVAFKQNIAKRTALYSYPTGEEWPFVFPCTDEEFQTGITDIFIDRNPKFEIVYAPYHNDPLIQIDIQTSFTKEHIENLFPYPYGLSLQGLEQVFRSVYIKTNWCGVILRLDLRFQTEESDFGAWILNKGQRY